MEDDELLKNWMNSIIRSRRGDFTNANCLCLGMDPKPKSTIPKRDMEFCTEAIWIKTYVKANFVAFCKTHSQILLQYLDHLIKALDSSK